MIDPRVAAAFAYFEEFANLERTVSAREYRLDRMRRLSEGLANPHLETPAVHVAGSKGKGTVTAMIAALLAEGSTPVGVYASPHVFDYRERIRTSAGFFCDEGYLAVGDRLRRYVDGRRTGAPDDEPTTFELLTLAAFLLFARERLRYGVYETGLGGRLDATNILDPRISVITTIELEHTEILGPDLPSIAGEKAGIIKPNRPVFLGAIVREAAEVIERRAHVVGAPVVHLASAVPRIDRTPVAGGERVTIGCSDGFSVDTVVPMLGRHQATNAALAVAAARAVRPEITEHQATSALERVHLPARGEVLASSPMIVADGAHTTESLSAAVEAVASRGGGRPIVLFATTRGKDLRRLAPPLAGVAAVVVTRAGTFKPADPQSVADQLRALLPADGPPVLLNPDPADALAIARSEAQARGAPLLITGSMYLLGEVYPLLGKRGRDVA